MKHKPNYSNVPIYGRALLKTVQLVVGVKGITGVVDEVSKMVDFSAPTHEEAEQKARDYVKANKRRYIIGLERLVLIGWNLLLIPATWVLLWYNFGHLIN